MSSTTFIHRTELYSDNYLREELYNTDLEARGILRPVLKKVGRHLLQIQRALDGR